MSIRNAIIRAVEKQRKRGYNQLYWAFDLHNSIAHPYTDDFEYFPYAKEVLANLSRNDEMVLILFTSTYMKNLMKPLMLMENDGIEFAFINRNPAFPSNDLSDFSSKFAFDIMVEDKAGFDAEHDWKEIKETLEELGLWMESENVT